MRLLGLIFVCALSFLWFSQGASAQCTTTSGRSAPYSTVRVSFADPANTPTVIQEGATDAMGAWNSATCNVGGLDFPIFLGSGTASEVIPVFYNPGIGTVRDGNNNTTCALINYGGATNGSNASIEIYGRIQLADGRIGNCFNTREDAASSISHELGHYLGLNDSTCSGYIMSSRNVSIVNNQFVWDTSRQVQLTECQTADSSSSTPGESAGGSGVKPIKPSCQVSGCTPIVIDLDGRGFRFTSLADGVFFDIDADGEEDWLSWTKPASRDAFLVLDRNDNGRIDDGTELFGGATPQLQSEAPNGFLALSLFDDPLAGGNGDGLLSAADAHFAELGLWTDTDHDGQSSPEEVVSLLDEGIDAIDLTPLLSSRRDRYGNQLRWASQVHFQSRGRRLAAVDVIFVVQ